MLTKMKNYLVRLVFFPFIFKEPTRRSSKNRPAGTFETKAIISVTKDIIRSCLINQVLPAILSKWLRSSGHETIFIQQDNAKPHIQPFDLQFLEAATKDGSDIRLSNQPPSSPDMNVLDLGYLERFNHCNIKRRLRQLMRLSMRWKNLLKICQWIVLIMCSFHCKRVWLK